MYYSNATGLFLRTRFPRFPGSALSTGWSSGLEVRRRGSDQFESVVMKKRVLQHFSELLEIVFGLLLVNTSRHRDVPTGVESVSEDVTSYLEDYHTNS
ncbi:unnamed protein product [Calypogeia fissa]